MIGTADGLGVLYTEKGEVRLGRGRRLTWLLAGLAAALAAAAGVYSVGAGAAGGGSHHTAPASIMPALVHKGSTLVATLADVPPGDGVFLAGVAGDNALDPSAKLLVLTTCQTSGSKATCTFRAPDWSGDVTYAGYTTTGLMSSPITLAPDGTLTGSAPSFAHMPPSGAPGPAADLVLNVAPFGVVPPGTPMTGSVSGVPVGDNVFLVGSAQDATGGGNSVLVLTACTTRGTAAACHFKAPVFAGQVNYQVRLVGSADPSMVVAVSHTDPLNNLPEVPLAVALPLMMAALVGVQVWRRRGAERR